MQTLENTLYTVHKCTHDNMIVRYVRYGAHMNKIQLCKVNEIVNWVDSIA